MRKFAFVSNILRLLRDEIQYELERFPPKRPITKFNSFALNDLPGEQWIKLTRKFGEIEDIKVDSKIFHGSIPVSKLFIQEKDNHDGHKVESSVSNYDNAYKKLDNLDFMTAAKILFTDPPKKKKFGIDFHLVQLFFACMPSLAVYLVAQYARYEMRRMEAELEQKKELEDKKRQEEEEKAKELELIEVEEKIKSNPEFVEVKKRLGKLEEAVNEIVVESKKKSRGVIVKTLDHGDEKKHPTKSEPANTKSK